MLLRNLFDHVTIEIHWKLMKSKGNMNLFLLNTNIFEKIKFCGLRWINFFPYKLGITNLKNLKKKKIVGSKD